MREITKFLIFLILISNIELAHSDVDKLKFIIVKSDIKEKLVEFAKAEHNEDIYRVNYKTKKAYEDYRAKFLIQSDKSKIEFLKTQRIKFVDNKYEISKLIHSEYNDYKENIPREYIDNAYIEAKKENPDPRKFDKFYKISQNLIRKLIYTNEIEDHTYENSLEEVLSKAMIRRSVLDELLFKEPTRLLKGYADGRLKDKSLLGYMTLKELCGGGLSIKNENKAKYYDMVISKITFWTDKNYSKTKLTCLDELMKQRKKYVNP